MILSEIKDKIFNGSLSTEETLEYFSNDVDYTDDLLDLFEKALDQLNPGAIEILLYASSCNGHLDKRYSSIMKKLLSEPKMLNHNLETIVESLQYIKDPSTVDNLYQACLDFPYSDEHSIPIKAMWALRDIGTLEALEKLTLLVNSEDNRISLKAQQQLEYLKQKIEST